ncbi:MAG: restriction endonuclease subunit S [Oscillospiraceae bacterium]|nr:restriction endonuclease subunit S [Oscillospiraceae bacterium]
MKLDELCEINMGQSPKSEYYNTDCDGLPFLQGNRTFGAKYPTFDTYTTLSTKIAEAGDVIMSVRAPVGDVNITPVNMCLGRGVCALRHKNGQQEFLYYLMRHYAHKLINQESGTVFGSVNRNDIANLEINVPPIAEQIGIGRILGALDNKIENNAAINHNLEQMAQAIFKSWLVDFEPFIDSKFIESELGEIPVGWRVVPLSDITSLTSGYSYKSSELQPSNIAMVTIKNFERKGGFKSEGFKEIVVAGKIKPAQYAELFDILVAHTDLTQNADVVGNSEMLLTLGQYEKIIISLDLVKVKANIAVLSNFVLASILRSPLFKRHALGYVNGTTVLHLSKKAIPEYKVALPVDMSVLVELSNLLEAIYTKIVKNMHENDILVAFRDILLPRLMSGELSITGLDSEMVNAITTDLSPKASWH